MRQLLPHPRDEVDLGALYGSARPSVRGRPWVAALMVSSADGAVAVDGRSGTLGGEGDGEVFRAVRAAADAIVVGSGTVTAEGYGPVRSAGRTGVAPRLVIVSGRLSLTPDQRVFAEADGTTPPPLVVHPPGAPAERRARLADVAELVEVAADDDGGVDAGAVLGLLHERGHAVAVLEGGPTLNGGFVGADLVDELCLTLDPRVVGGPSPRVVATHAPGTLRDWAPAHLLEHDGALFWRLLRAR
jgi:riboflavin biosynthesis pyrimidine reductase